MAGEHVISRPGAGLQLPNVAGRKGRARCHGLECNQAPSPKTRAALCAQVLHAHETHGLGETLPSNRLAISVARLQVKNRQKELNSEPPISVVRLRQDFGVSIIAGLF